MSLRREGATPLPLYNARTAVVRAARIVEVDHVLAQVVVELPGGRVEMRHCSPIMFAGGCMPMVGDYLVDRDGERWVEPKVDFERTFVSIGAHL